MCYTETVTQDVDVIIIGAGVAGLTCGCLLAKKGLRVAVIEKNEKLGGCCSSFQKSGFSFDLSVQSLGECRRGGRIWSLLNELNLLGQIHFIPLEPAREYHFPDRSVIQSSKLETHIETLSSLFPEERKGIEQVYSVLHGVYEEFSRNSSALHWFNFSSFSSQYPLLSQYRDKTYGELLNGWITHPLLKAILSVRSSYALLPPEEISLVAMAGIEMSYFDHGVSCVEGRVEEFPLKMGEALRKMGGRIFLGTEVRKILIEGGSAIGVWLERGVEMTAKVIISNVDANTTFSEFLEENSVPKGFRSKLKGMRPSLSYFIVYLGIEGEIEELSLSNHEVFFDDSFQREYRSLYANRIPEEGPFYLLVPSKVNPSHAPQGKSTLCLSLKAPYQFYQGWDQEVKDQLSSRLIAKASAFIPNLEKRILVKETATPKTIEQWTGNRWGAAYGWAQIPGQSGIHRLPRATPIPNLYLTGHWTSPGGGIVGVVASGELTAKTICEKFEKGVY